MSLFRKSYCRPRYDCCLILPDHILDQVSRNSRGKDAEAAKRSMNDSARLLGNRQILSLMMMAGDTPPGVKSRTCYDMRNRKNLPGGQKRREGAPPTGDLAIDEAYDFSGVMYDMLSTAFQRNSLDNRGMRLDNHTHYGVRFQNAYFDGRRMIFGDGDGKLFGRFTASLSVVAHELGHGVVAASANLDYYGQPGAANESWADIYGVMAQAFFTNTPSNQLTWDIGKELLMPGVNGTGVRNMLRPGAAYDDKKLGKDPQPDSMDGWADIEEDSGGVHIFSGILNRAFATFCLAVGGNCWEKPGQVWHRALTKYLERHSDFSEVAAGVISSARDLFGEKSKEEEAARAAYDLVKIKPKVA